MYRLSLLPRKVIITTDEVIAQGPTDNDVDPRVILQSIQIAEERFIKSALCKSLYYDFRDKKNVVVTNANKATHQSKFTGTDVTLKEGDIVNAIELVENVKYKELWNEHLWKLIAECVIYIASPTNFSRFTAQGEMINNPKTVNFGGGDGQGSVSAELKQMQWKLDRMMMDRIDPLITSMHEWICDNKADFPKYDCKECEDCSKSSGATPTRKSAWVHGIYNDRRRNCDDE